jgi:hypothetical protein
MELAQDRASEHGLGLGGLELVRLARGQVPVAGGIDRVVPHRAPDRAPGRGPQVRSASTCQAGASSEGAGHAFAGCESGVLDHGAGAGEAAQESCAPLADGCPSQCKRDPTRWCRQYPTL